MVLQHDSNNDPPPHPRTTEKGAINTQSIAMHTYKTDRNEYRYQCRYCLLSFLAECDLYVVIGTGTDSACCLKGSSSCSLARHFRQVYAPP
jgi:hypothetical protein